MSRGFPRSRPGPRRSDSVAASITNGTRRVTTAKIPVRRTRGRTGTVVSSRGRDGCRRRGDRVVGRRRRGGRRRVASVTGRGTTGGRGQDASYLSYEFTSYYAKGNGGS